jgi:hypothetical protein
MLPLAAISGSFTFTKSRPTTDRDHEPPPHATDRARGNRGAPARGQSPQLPPDRQATGGDAHPGPADLRRRQAQAPRLRPAWPGFSMVLAGTRAARGPGLPLPLPRGGACGHHLRTFALAQRHERHFLEGCHAALRQPPDLGGSPCLGGSSSATPTLPPLSRHRPRPEFVRRFRLGDHPADEHDVGPGQIALAQLPDNDLHETLAQSSGRTAATVSKPKGGREACLRMDFSACLKFQNAPRELRVSKAARLTFTPNEATGPTARYGGVTPWTESANKAYHKAPVRADWSQCRFPEDYCLVCHVTSLPAFFVLGRDFSRTRHTD